MKFIFVPVLFISFLSSAQTMFIENKGSEKSILKNIIEIKISLSGTITDAKTGEPLAGASLYLTDDKIGAIANEKGKYEKGKYPLLKETLYTL